MPLSETDFFTGLKARAPSVFAAIVTVCFPTLAFGKNGAPGRCGDASEMRGFLGFAALRSE